MNLKRKSAQFLWSLLEDLRDMESGVPSAFLELKYGDWYSPTPDQLREARAISPDVATEISAVMCEIERREPGTFITPKYK